MQIELSNPYQLHQTIMNGFPHDLKNTNNFTRILYRLNINSTSGVPTVLVQSLICPDWGPLISKKNYFSKDPLFKQFEYPDFKAGSLYRFKLYANPTKKIEGKRLGLYKAENHFKWLNRKAELGGFKLLKVDIIKTETLIAKAIKKSKRITLQAVQFEGILQVVNPTLFSDSLKNGIGSGKAFGFGLLSIGI